MTKRITRLVAAIAALAALALGGAAIAGAIQGQPDPGGAVTEAAEPNEATEADEGSEADQEKGRQATGPDAERAKKAALAATGGGEATSVQQEEPESAETDEGAESAEPGEKAGSDKQEGFQSPAGSAWEVEVTKGSEQLEVYLDKDFKVLDTAPAEQE